MNNIWFTSDHHFGHANMIRFSKRMNKGQKPTHFGSKIEFQTSGQLADFVTEVLT